MGSNGKMFRTSKPYGYYIPDVDAAIDKYNDAISKLKETIIDYQTKLKQLENENDQLKQELKSMHMQMTMMELPQTSEATEHMLLDEFSGKIGDHKKIDESITDDDFEDNILIATEISSNSSAKESKKAITSFDDLQIVE